MATGEVEAAVAAVSEPEEGCLLVRVSPEESLYFVSTADYLQYLISHGGYCSGARVEPRRPPGTQLQVNNPVPAQSTPDETDPKSSTTASEGISLNTAVLSGSIGLVKALVKQSSTTSLNSTDEQGLTLLLHAVLSGAHDIAAVLLKAGASPDIPHSATGASPLSLACLQGHTELAKLLLKHRASLAPDVHGCSPLHSAVWGSGCVKIVKTLLSHKPSLLAERDNYGRTPLHLAAAKGDVTVCQLLMKKGSVLSSEIDDCGRTALHWAILSQQLSCVEHLLSSSSGCAADSQGATPVHYAALTGQCSLLTALENKGANTAVTDANGHSPLFWACACGHVDTARQLTTRDIPTNDSSQPEQETEEEESFPLGEGGACLRVSCSVGSLAVAQLLIHTSPTLVRERDEEGRTALHTASYHGHTKCIDELLKAGAPPNIATYIEKRTSLHVASERGHCEVVARLLASGANLNCSTHPHGERPIHLAAHRGHSSIIIELLRRGCSPDIDRASDGLTALMLAAEADHTQCCRLLVESGANTSLTENGVQSRTALDLAMAGGHREVSDYLVSVGAPSRGGKFHRGAVTIQTVWRHYRHNRRQRSRRGWSAAVIQRCVRRWTRRRRARRVRERRERARGRAAAVIQRHWRQYMEGRRRYEATCARLRARLHQEHLAASILLEELQTQSHSICLPPPTSPRATPHKAPGATPGYLLQASAPLPAPRITSAAILPPTHTRTSISVPVVRPRKPLTHSPRTNLPPQPSQPSPSHSAHPIKSPLQPVIENTREEEMKEGPISTTLPAISPQPLVDSSKPSQPGSLRRERSLQKKAVGARKTKAVIERVSDSLPVIPTTERPRMMAGGREETDQGAVVEELPPLPPTPSLVSPSLPSPPPPPHQTPPPSLISPPPLPHQTSPPSLTSPPPPPHQTPPHHSPTSPVAQTETTSSQEEERTVTAPCEKNIGEKQFESELQFERVLQFEPKRENQPLQKDGKLHNKDKKPHYEDKKPHEKGEGEKVPEEPLPQQYGADSRRYLKQTVFRSSILGQQQGESGGGESEEREPTLDDRLLGPIQRYDRLNTVLALLQKVKGGEGDQGEEGPRLSDLQQHIQTALDEAVRLRADTEALQHSAKMKLPQKPTNSVH